MTSAVMVVGVPVLVIAVATIVSSLSARARARRSWAPATAASASTTEAMFDRELPAHADATLFRVHNAYGVNMGGPA